MKNWASREMNELYSILHGWNKGKFVVNEEEDGFSVLLGSEKGRKNLKNEMKTNQETTTPPPK